MEEAKAEKPKRAKRGRPSGNPKWANNWQDLLFERMAGGRSGRSVCSDKDIPGRAYVLKLLADDSVFAGHYARAHEERAHFLADECLEIVDDGSNDWMEKHDPDNPGYDLNGEHIQRSKLRTETRLKLMAMVAPKVYGNKLAIDATVSGPEMSEEDKVDRFLAQVPLLNAILSARGLMVQIVETDA